MKGQALRRPFQSSMPDERGFTLVEAVLASSLLLVAFLGFAATIASTSRLAEDTRSTRVVSTAFHNLVEVLRADDFSALTQRYGEGTANPEFWCNADGDVAFIDPGDSPISGSITFFDDESNIPVSFAAFGQSFDLNADGAISKGTVTDYMVLPARVEFTIDGSVIGPRSVSIDLILTPIQSS